MNRAYGFLETKALSDDKRILKGVATTISPDRMDDIVESRGAEFKLPLPLLSQHDHHLPIGTIYDAKVFDDRIEIEAEIAKDTGLDYVETAWKQLKAQLVRGLSIGFRSLEHEWITDEKGRETGGIRFKRWEMMETSCVTIAANAQATITALKSYDQDPVKRSQVVNALSERHSRIDKALERIERAKAALEIRKS